MAKVFIYALHCPESGEIRYIGKANNPEKRFAGHMREIRRKTPLYDWIQKLRTKGLCPKLSIISETNDENWENEEIYQIKKHFDSGCRLLNLAKGGDMPFCSNEQRAKNGVTTAKKIHSSPELKRLWQIKHSMSLSMRFFKQRNMTETYNKMVDKLHLIATKHPIVFGDWLRFQKI